ncbi:MAG: hypothetical protein LBU99_00290, partial [Spirochaetaceae bacterium]|nr:hypothetical protein [Spirochaetaceae bacterium]
HIFCPWEAVSSVFPLVSPCSMRSFTLSFLFKPIRKRSVKEGEGSKDTLSVSLIKAVSVGHVYEIAGL